MDSKTFLTQLPPVYWSPKHPSTYVMPTDADGRKRTAGIGLIAMQYIPAWNLIYDKFDMSDKQQNFDSVASWVYAKRALEVELHGVPLGDTMVALGPVKWKAYWAKHKKLVPRGFVHQMMEMSPRAVL